MQPLDRRVRSRPVRAARARRRIECELGWLTGFPDPAATRADVPRWIALDPSAVAHSTPVTRDRIRLAVRALVWLGAGRAGDTRSRDRSAWVRATGAILDVLKRWVHDGVPPPPNPLALSIVPPHLARAARALAERHPGIVPIVDAVTWALAAHPDRLAAALELASEAAVPLARIASTHELPHDRTLAVRLVACAHEGKAPLAAVLAWLGASDLRAVDGARDWAVRAVTALRQGKLAPRLDAPPLPTGGVTALRALAGSALDWSRERRSLGLALLASTATADLREAWEAWWRRIEPLAVDTRRALARSGAEVVPERTRLALEIEAVVPPPHGTLEDLARDIHRATADPPLARAMLRALEPLALAPIGFSAHLVAGWMDFVDRGQQGPLTAWLPHATRVLAAARKTVADAIGPWLHGMEDGHRVFPVEHALFDEPHVRGHWESVAASLVRLGRRYDSFTVPIVVALARRGIPPAVIARVARDAAAHSPLRAAHYVEERIVALALTVAPFEAARFAHRLAWAARLELDDPHHGALARAVATTRAAGLGGVEWSAELEPALVTRVVRLLRAFELVGVAPPPWPAPEETPDGFAWTSRYPVALRPALERLGGTDGARAAARLLSRYLPAPDRLAAEIAALDLRLAREGGREALVRRRAALARRAAAPEDLAPRRIVQLLDRVDAAALRAGLGRWHSALSLALAAAVGASASQAEWFYRPSTLELLPHLLALEPRMRALALELLARRAGPPPWDLRELPANRAFATAMAARGLDLAPWLDATPTAIPTATGTLELGLEPDPLEVLRMGAWFGTCLSPGAMNFHSAVANAVDLNKRVLVGRRRGTVVGRTLLALGERGGLVAFEAYGGDPDYPAAAADWTLALARRIGTAHAQNERVPLLAAPAWYDDGPAAARDRYAWTRAGSALRTALGSATGDELERIFSAQLAVLDDEATAELASVEELAKDPAKLVRCAALVDPVSRPRTMRAIASGLWHGRTHEAAATPEARCLLRAALVPWVAHALREGEAIPDAAELLVDAEPARLLSMLKGQLRPARRGRRAWVYGDRLLWAARCHRALGRAGRALELCEQALARGRAGYHAHELGQLIAELGPAARDR